jgi:16S rRNA (guanine527-N7)-methyltransferase
MTSSGWRMTIQGFEHVPDSELLSAIVKETMGTTSMVAGIERWFMFLQDSNRDLNLVSRKLSTRTLLTEHVYDCLAGFSYFEQSRVIYDLGSGGGFPGILLAICFPGKSVHCVEKSPRKAEYLIAAKKKFSLENLNVHSCTVDSVALDGDTVTCRAFKPIDVICSLTSAFIKRGGTYLLYKGRKKTIEEEYKKSKRYLKSTTCNYIIESIAPRLDKERHMVTLHID